MPYLIGIAGGSGSGKTTLAQKICELTPRSCVLSLDNYYQPGKPGNISWDDPRSLDTVLLQEHLWCILYGRAFSEPEYDFKTSTRTRGNWHGMRHAELVNVWILEGLWTLHYPWLRARLDWKIFLDVDPETCLERRIMRDAIRAGRHADDTRQRWRGQALPAYYQFVEPTRQYADLVSRASIDHPRDVLPMSMAA